MRHLLVPLLLLLPPLTTAQQLIPTNLPACAQQCTVLQQAQTGCVPNQSGGGAPVTNQGIYQSCFCQSALLPQLYTSSPVQLCSTCDAADMLTIQNWYKSFCGKGGAPVPANGPSTTATSPTTSTKSTVNPATAGATVTGQQDDGVSTDTAPSGPWMSTHWKWIVMLVVIFAGLAGLAIAFYFLHRRYHRKREAEWSTAAASQPDITTWGPGQSVHDLGFTRNPAADGFEEKGKMRDGMPEPKAMYQGGGEGSGSGRFF